MQIYRLLICCAFIISVAYCQSSFDTFDLDEAKRFTMYSYASYCLPQNISAWDCYWCDYLDIQPIKVATIFQNASENTLGYAGVTNDSIVFAFRGTEITSIQNWIEDIESEILVNYSNFYNAEVGLGFYSDYLGIQTEVISTAKILRNSYPDLPFVFTGHSLGAALSTLAAIDVSISLNEPPSSMFSITLGSPRVGEINFANATDKIFGASFRMVNQDDIVPHLPPHVILPFHHITTEVWFSNTTYQYEICTQGDGEDPNCSDSVPFFEFSVDDHLLYLGYYQRAGEQYGCV